MPTLPATWLRPFYLDLCRAHGAPSGIPAGPVRVDPVQSRDISDAYLSATETLQDPATRAAYRALAAECYGIVDALRAEGLDVIYTPDDPYQNSADMIGDVRDNRRLRVFTGGAPHSLLGAANDAFRAVHDALGHAVVGNGFGAVGEETAYRVQRAAHSPLARRALTTETRGQTAVFRFGPTPGAYAPQRALILPAWADTILSGY